MELDKQYYIGDIKNYPSEVNIVGYIAVLNNRFVFSLPKQTLESKYILEFDNNEILLIEKLKNNLVRIKNMNMSLIFRGDVYYDLEDHEFKSSYTGDTIK